MNSSELDQLLRQTLADEKLAGSEKTLLTGWAMKNLDSEADRGAARKLAFEIARQQAGAENSRRVLLWLEEVLKVLVPVQAGASNQPISADDQAFFSPGDACLQQIVHRLQSARRSVDICVFTITDDRITRNILAAHKRGVQLRLITDNDKALDAGSDIEQIEAAGIPLKVDRTAYHMHHKFAIFDGTRLLNGSYNWTRSAADVNEENIVDTGNAKLVAAFQKEFDALWKSL
jgi:mitochondrial cardiolipin hydrolase